MITRTEQQQNKQKRKRGKTDWERLVEFSSSSEHMRAAEYTGSDTGSIPIEVDAVGVHELTGITGRRAERQQHHVVGLEREAVEVDVLHDQPAVLDH